MGPATAQTPQCTVQAYMYRKIQCIPSLDSTWIQIWPVREVGGLVVFVAQCLLSRESCLRLHLVPVAANQSERSEARFSIQFSQAGTAGAAEAGTAEAGTAEAVSLVIMT
ncbi:hypothetical protein E4U41_000657 [Claviceps citrina]|nr:hypothetical protein E4U41_000657 [Claviceps citrina]